MLSPIEITDFDPYDISHLGLSLSLIIVGTSGVRRGQSMPIKHKDNVNFRVDKPTLVVGCTVHREDAPENRLWSKTFDIIALQAGDTLKIDLKGMAML